MPAPRKLRQIVAALLALLLLAAPVAAGGHAPWEGRVQRVIDGDTLVVDGQRVRLAAADAPERDQPYGLPAWGLAVVVAGDEPVLVLPVARGAYGRLIARVVVLRTGTDLSDALAAAGLAWVRCRATCPGTRALADAARREKRGLLADPNPCEPAKWRRRECK
jgi:endonuclease YncB( thermonuclease family)